MRSRIIPPVSSFASEAPAKASSALRNGEMKIMATAPKMKSGVAEVLTEDVRKRASEARTTSTAAEAQEFQNIEANSFYKVMFSKELSPEQKREEVAKALVFAGSREEMKTRLQEFESFKEYLQTVREEMAKEIIGLTDTEAFSELKLVYDELNDGVLAFEEKMKPLTDIIDALYVLRTKGQTMEAFEEIKKAREEEARIKSERQTVEQEVSALEERIRTTQYHIAELAEDKSFFGLG